MGLLDNYAVIHNYSLNIDPVEVFDESKYTEERVDILPDAKHVTIAEISPIAKGKITAHKLKDYRRKSFSLMLLPDVDLLIDSLLEEPGDLNECSEFTSTYNNG